MSPPPGFRRWEVAFPPGSEREYDEAEWRDALVLVERGEIELERGPGERGRFGPGAVLCLTGLELRLIRNPSNPHVAFVLPVKGRGQMSFRPVLRPSR